MCFCAIIINAILLFTLSICNCKCHRCIPFINIIPIPISLFQSTPNLPESEPNHARLKRRSSLTEIKESLASEDLGFKMNIFLSGLSSSQADSAVVG